MMRTRDSKSSLESVQSIAGSLLPNDPSIAVNRVLAGAPVPPPLGEGERLLFAIRASFERLFRSNHHSSQFPQTDCSHHHPCFHFPRPATLNPFVVIQGAYSQALEKLEVARKPLEARRPGVAQSNGSVQMKEGLASFLAGEVQTLLSEADRFSRSDNPADRTRASHARLKALQLLQIISCLTYQVRRIKTSYQ